MRQTITKKDLENASLAYAVEVNELLGLPIGHTLDHPSPKNGRAARMYAGDMSPYFGLDSYGYLGVTRREAYNKLTTLTRCLQSVRQYLNDKEQAARKKVAEAQGNG